MPVLLLLHCFALCKHKKLCTCMTAVQEDSNDVSKVLSDTILTSDSLYGVHEESMNLTREALREREKSGTFGRKDSSVSGHHRAMSYASSYIKRNGSRRSSSISALGESIYDDENSSGDDRSDHKRSGADHRREKRFLVNKIKKLEADLTAAQRYGSGAASSNVFSRKKSVNSMKQHPGPVVPGNEDHQRPAPLLGEMGSPTSVSANMGSSFVMSPLFGRTRGRSSTTLDLKDQGTRDLDLHQVCRPPQLVLQSTNTCQW